MKSAVLCPLGRSYAWPKRNVELRQTLENDSLIRIVYVEWNAGLKTTIAACCDPANLDRVIWRRRLSSPERGANIRAQHDQEGNERLVDKH